METHQVFESIRKERLRVFIDGQTCVVDREYSAGRIPTERRRGVIHSVQDTAKVEGRGRCRRRVHGFAERDYVC